MTQLSNYSSANPLVTVLKLLIPDPRLRREFIQDPSKVFSRLGLGCPKDFVGRKGNFCPTMPQLPPDSAANDISHPYWRDWLSGGVEQLADFQRVLDKDARFPSRSTFSTESEWNAFVDSIVSHIKEQLVTLHEMQSNDDS